MEMKSRMQSIVRKVIENPFRFAMALNLSGLCLWMVLAETFVPSLISNAYEGLGPGPLNRFFAGRASKKLLDYYLGLWTDLEFAVVFAGFAHLVLIYLIQRSRLSNPIKVLMIIAGGAFLGFTVLFGPRQDYVAHIQIWNEIIRGNNPWWIQPESGIILNAYGPLFNLFAIPAAINPMLPKICFALVYLLFCVWILDIYESEAGLRGWPQRLLIGWLFNPGIWLEIAFYGHFDVLMAVLIVAALHFHLSQKQVQAGALIGAGFLLKFLPAVAIPFLVVRGPLRRDLRVRTFLTAIFMIISGMAIACWIWGFSTFRPLIFASERGSSLISVWRYLRGTHSPLKIFISEPVDLDSWALPVMLVMLTIVFALNIVRRTEVSHMVFLSILTTLIFYRVGFLQYQMVLFLILPYWFAQNADQIKTDRILQFVLTTYLLWIIGFDLFDNAVGGIIGTGRPYAWVEEWAGLPTFLTGISLWLVLLIRASRFGLPSVPVNGSSFHFR